jgi:5'-deoxynucleotidase
MIRRDEADKLNPSVFERILERENGTCPLCTSTYKEKMVLYEVIPHTITPDDWESLDLATSKYDVEDKVCLICSSCCHKLEGSMHSASREFLQKEVWSPTSKLPFFRGSRKALGGALGALRLMSHTKRFASDVTLRDENLAEHSYWVTTYSRAIGQAYVKRYNLKESFAVDWFRVMMMAHDHDVPEVITTDVVQPIKSVHPEVEARFEITEGRVCKELEKQLDVPRFIQHITEFNEKKTLESKICQAADKLSGLVFCVEEIALGNRNLEIALQRYYSYTIKQVLEDGKPTQMLWQKKLLEDLTNWIKVIVSPSVLNGGTEEQP